MIERAVANEHGRVHINTGTENGQPLRQKRQSLKKFNGSDVKQKDFNVLCVCLFGFLTPSSTIRLYRGRAPRQSV